MEYRKIPGFENYSVSDTGIVRRDNCESKYVLKAKTLKIDYSVKGYARVHLDKQSFMVHRLVAMAFVPGYTEERHMVNHKDGNKRNNNHTNLEWVTSQENNIHAVRVLGCKRGKSIIGLTKNERRSF